MRLFARSWGYTGEAGYVPHYPEIHKIELARLSAFLFTPPWALWWALSTDPQLGAEMCPGERRSWDEEEELLITWDYLVTWRKTKEAREENPVFNSVVFKIKENACRKSYRFPFFFFLVECTYVCKNTFTHTHSTHLLGTAFLLLLYTSIFCVWVHVYVVHVEWEWGGGGGIKQYRLWVPLGRISEFPGIGSSLRKQESLTFPPNNKGGTGKIKGEWGWRGKKKTNRLTPV